MPSVTLTIPEYIFLLEKTIQSEIRVLFNHAHHLKIYTDVDLQAASLHRQCFNTQ